MGQVSVRLAVLGEPFSFRGVDNVCSVRSKFLDFQHSIDYFQLRQAPDLEDWQYSVAALSRLCPKRKNEDVLLVLVSIPIEDNYILKRIGDCRVVLTTFEIGDALSSADIPLSNLILRMAYAVGMMKLCNNDILLTETNWATYSHAETRGCLFDMTPHKYDIHKSCVTPIICSECKERLVRDGVSSTAIEVVSSELKKNLRRGVYWRLVDFLDRRPVAAFGMATTWAVVVGALGSLLASWIWETFTRRP